MKPRARFTLQTVAFDTLAVAVAGLAASQLVFGVPILWEVPTGFFSNFRAIWPMGAMLAGGLILGSWQSINWVQPHISRPLYNRAWVAAAVGLAVTLVGVFTFRTYYSQAWVPLTLGFWLVLALGHRAVRRRHRWSERMVLVTHEKALGHELAESPHADVVDLLDPRGEAPSSALPANTTLVVDLTSLMSDGMARYVSSSTLAGYDVRSLSNVYEDHLGRVALVHLAEGWEISVPLEQRAPYVPFKRLVETALVLATSPLWLLLAGLAWVMVRTDSKGGAIFRQVRTGLNDKPFTMYKFRTMVDGAEDDGPQFTQPDDPRITRVGRFLRASRLDEIPQLWNVLRGDVALVGPRAEQLVFTRQFEAIIPFYRYRHLVRPGITGWAQVHHGYADDLSDTIEKLTYDLYYVRHMSPWLDFSIIMKTFLTMLTGRGAQ
ncbi:MAG: sugar transferase [Acidimicrobiia bacterium]